MRRTVLAVAGAVIGLALPAQAMAAKDHAATALNIIPSGQYGSLPVPPPVPTPRPRCTTG